MRPAFREHVRPHTKGREGERLGGGNVLGALWNHRGTRDVDAYVRLGTTEDGNRILDRAAAACGAYRVEHPTFKRLEFERNKDNHIDVTFRPPTPLQGERTVILDGEPTRILSTAQIMSGKLHGRGMTAPVRDLYDIAVCRLADPTSLESAVNGVPTEKLNAILSIYRNLEDQYRQDAPKISDTPDELTAIRENPTVYAHNAILDSRYTKATIRTDGGRAQVEVRTAADQRTVTYGTAEDLQEGLELKGVNAFLTAQDRDAESVLHATVEAMWANETITVIEVHPEPLKHTPMEASRIEWEPCGLPRAAAPTDDAETQRERRRTTCPFEDLGSPE